MMLTFRIFRGILKKYTIVKFNYHILFLVIN